MNTSRTSLACAALFASLIGCKDTGRATSGGAAVAKMMTFRDQMCTCKDTACAKKVSADMAAWSKNQPADKPAAMSADDQKKAFDVGTQIGECMMRATTGSAPAMANPVTPPPADGSGVQPPAGSGSAVVAPTKNAQGLPSECDAYKAAIDKLATCERMSKHARETLVKGYEDAAARWAGLPEASKATLSTACQGGVDAVLSVAKTQCGW